MGYCLYWSKEITKKVDDNPKKVYHNLIKIDCIIRIDIIFIDSENSKTSNLHGLVLISQVNCCNKVIYFCESRNQPTLSKRTKFSF